VLVVALAAVVGTALAGGPGGASIYPDDHWTYSTKLDSKNIESEVMKALDAGKTMFVRFVASSG